MIKTRHFTLALGLFLLIFPLDAQEKSYSGVIFLDKNKNGIQDPGERGVKGIPVSNGKEVVLTNKKGEYQLTGDHNTSIFPILPSDYRLTCMAGKKGNFYYYYCGKEGTPQTGLNYPIQKQKVVSDFRLSAVGDPQVRSHLEMDFAAQSIYGELLNHPEISMNLFLGDMVHEKMELFEESQRLIEQLPGNALVVPGNHDRNYEATRNNQDSVFITHFGASTYSYNQGDVHFILLNDVLPISKKSYRGEYTAKQLEFVRNDLKQVPKERLVIIAQHIPINQTTNGDSILALLNNYPHVLLLAGHTHNVARNLIKQNERQIQQIVAGTSCGHFWRGELDWEGIPSALMNCGAPRCYFTVDVKKNQYQIQFKAIGRDDADQMNIWVNSALPQDEADPRRDPKIKIDTISPFTKFQPDAIVATIYGGCNQSQVRIQIDGGEWQNMQHVKESAPMAARMRRLAKTSGYPTSYSTPLNLREAPSPLVWVYNPQNGFQKGVHSITIEASDNYGFKVKKSRIFTK